MSYDPVIYHTLTPLAMSLKTFAGVMFVLAFLFHWVLGAWFGVRGHDPKAGQKLRDAFAALAVLCFFYVPVPDPARLLGLREEVPLAEVTYDRTTAGIFLFERISYGVDSLATTFLAWDTTVQALERQEAQDLDVNFGSVAFNREPNNADIIFSFIALRGQFVARYAQHLWNEPPLPEARAEDGETWGAWDLLKALASREGANYLTQQAAAMLYTLASSLMLILAMLLLFLISALILALAAAARFAAIFSGGLFLLVLPIAYFFRGWRAFTTGINLTLVYVFLKLGAILVIWMSFFILEGVMLQGIKEVAAENLNPTLAGIVDHFKPGYLYTDSAQDLLFSIERQSRMATFQLSTAKTLVSFLALLLATVYMIFKLPSIIAAILGVQSLAGDLFNTLVYFALAAVGLRKFVGGKGPASAANALSKG